MSFFPNAAPRVWNVALAADQATTSVTFVDIPGMSVTFTPKSARVRASFTCACGKNGTGGTASFQVLLDGTPVTGVAGSNQGSGFNQGVPACCEVVLPVTAGSAHTIKVQWKIDSGGSANCDVVSSPGNVNASLWVEEVA